jgi:3-hydroxyacyl-[acyl-carrier-protein] dehydratase
VSLAEGPVTLLVVDDEEAIRNSVRRYLVHQGYEVATAATGEEAMALLQRRKVTGMLLDVNLPGTNGIDLVPQILELEPNQRIVGVKNVTMNEPFFVGHFPGYPVMPGVLILEALAQTAAIMAMSAVPEEKRAGKVTYFMAIDGARFRKPVVPGDRLELHCTMVRSKGSVIKVKGEAKVDGETVAEAELMAMLADA